MAFVECPKCGSADLSGQATVTRSGGQWWVDDVDYVSCLDCGYDGDEDDFKPDEEVKG